MFHNCLKIPDLIKITVSLFFPYHPTPFHFLGLESEKLNLIQWWFDTYFYLLCQSLLISRRVERIPTSLLLWKWENIHLQSTFCPFVLVEINAELVAKLMNFELLLVLKFFIVHSNEKRGKAKDQRNLGWTLLFCKLTESNVKHEWHLQMTSSLSS